MRILLAILLALTGACRGGEEEAQLAAGVEPWVWAPADTQWVNIEGVEFPAGVEKADREVLESYVFAAKHPEVLSSMPCYCGCENPPSEHRSNYDCFVDMIDRTGPLPRVSPDPMGFA